MNYSKFLPVVQEEMQFIFLIYRFVAFHLVRRRGTHWANLVEGITMNISVKLF